MASVGRDCKPSGHRPKNHWLPCKSQAWPRAHEKQERTGFLPPGLFVSTDPAASPPRNSSVCRVSTATCLAMRGDQGHPALCADNKEVGSGQNAVRNVGSVGSELGEALSQRADRPSVGGDGWHLCNLGHGCSRPRTWRARPWTRHAWDAAAARTDHAPPIPRH